MDKKDIFLSGCAACAMFFGSGNIVLPLIIGQAYPDIYNICFVGFIIGAVFLPLMGLIAISLKSGSSQKFFDWLGPVPTFLIQLFILSLLGPFGILPRCLTVAFGGFKAIAPNFSSYLFYFLFCLIIWGITYQHNKIMPIISKFLTPIKLSMLIGTVIICLAVATPSSINVVTVDTISAFNKSILYGYQTMDLVSAIYYGSLIVEYITKKNKTFSKKDLLFFGLKSSAIAGVLLCVLYLGFLRLAIIYHDSIVGVDTDILFITIAESGLGHLTAVLVGITIVMSCLTTAIAIMSSWTKFLMGYITAKYPINPQFIIIPSFMITLAFAVIGLNGILEILEPILTYVYPVIIIITCVNIYTEIKAIYYKS